MTPKRKWTPSRHLTDEITCILLTQRDSPFNWPHLATPLALHVCVFVLLRTIVCR